MSSAVKKIRIGPFVIPDKATKLWISYDKRITTKFGYNVQGLTITVIDAYIESLYACPREFIITKFVQMLLKYILKNNKTLKDHFLWK